MIGSMDEAEIERIDQALQDWRQGDVALAGGMVMVHLADRRSPLTKASRDAAEGVSDKYDTFEVLTPVEGLVVVTQTCDIIKKCTHCEFVEVSPLIPVSDEITLEDVRKGRRPSYAYLPQLAGKRLVADLDRTMTIEKSVLAGWSRVEGCGTDMERVTFANALARKRQRFAFPDGFNAALRKFRNNIKDKNGKNSSEGKLVATLREVRVQPTPNWDAPEIEVFFWFLLEPSVFNTEEIDVARDDIEKWMKRIEFSGTFVLKHGAFSIVEPRDMSVEDYFGSYAIDYDDVSL